jgi:hypothetical protein
VAVTLDAGIPLVSAGLYDHPLNAYPVLLTVGLTGYAPTSTNVGSDNVVSSVSFQYI